MDMSELPFSHGHEKLLVITLAAMERPVKTNYGVPLRRINRLL